jgi:hypothetical protein
MSLADSSGKSLKQNSFSFSIKHCIIEVQIEYQNIRINAKKWIYNSLGTRKLKEHTIQL